MILLDTNVLVYAVGRDHALQPVAADLVSLAGQLPLRTTRRVVEEFAHVFGRGGRSRKEAAARARDWFDALGPVVSIEDDDVAAGFDLWQKHSGLHLFDATFAAAARRLDATLVSADRAYAGVAGLTWVDLAEPNLLDSLGASVDASHRT